MGAFSGKRDWGRLLTAMVTAFHDDGSVDYEETSKIAKYLVDEQANDGLVVNGTTGESATLSHEEKLKVLDAVLAAVGDTAAVVFGAGTNNTAESITLAREAEAAGAHGVMFVNPYYNRPGQAGLYAHFSACAAATTLPVMIYNIQPRSAINLETSTLMKLAEIGNIVAVKEASGSIAQTSDVCAKAPKGFRNYSGDDAMNLASLAVGGYGLVSVAAHLVGKEFAEMIRVFDSNPVRARELHHQVMPVVKAIFSSPSPVPVKYALTRRGFRCERVRLPLVELSPEEKAVVDAVL
jgi:4-hydroxy-tetrahydrodipicolinate synthase